MSFAESANQSIFDALRPLNRQSTARAVVATYSLDLVAALGLILSLGGHAEAEFNSTPLELVDAFEAMRGRLLILHQSGRVVAPRRHRGILLLLDDMLQGVVTERSCSWHPKIALVRYHNESGAYEWRFWIGSRNLTGSTDLDAGLLLVGRPGGNHRQFKDVARLAEDLLAHADWTDGELAELREAKWDAPSGVRLKELRWRRPGGTDRLVAKLGGKRSADAIFGMSPFLDQDGIQEAFGGTVAPQVLLTSRLDARKVAPLPGMTLLVRNPPQPHVAVAEDRTPTQDEPDFVEPGSNGVHAKILLRCIGQRAELMIGSANFTRRGLVGPNAEAVAVLDVEDAALIEGLKGFISKHLDFVQFDLDEEEQKLEAARRALDLVASQLLQIPFRIEARDGALHVATDETIDRLLKDVVFEIEGFASPSNKVEWLPGDASVQLTSHMPACKDQTAFVIMHLASRGQPKVARSWTQKLSLPAMDVEVRDRAALASYVGGARFRMWLRSVLDGIVGDGGSRWSDPPSPRPPDGPQAALNDVFSLEAMLARWTRNPAQFEAAIAKMSLLLASFRAAFEALPNGDERTQALADLGEVEPFLGSLIASLADEGR
jgi:hypothetical protein